MKKLWLVKGNDLMRMLTHNFHENEIVLDKEKYSVILCDIALENKHHKINYGS